MNRDTGLNRVIRALGEGPARFLKGFAPFLVNETGACNARNAGEIVRARGATAADPHTLEICEWDGSDHAWAKLNGITLADLGITASVTELNYTDGVTSDIQTQLNNKSDSGHTHTHTLNNHSDADFVGLATGDLAVRQSGGTWHNSLRVLTGSTTWDPGNIANTGADYTTVTVTGAAVGDVCIGSFSLATTQHWDVSATVRSANTVGIALRNWTGGTVNLGSGTLRATCFKNV